jgi:hypothetical protein
MGKVGVVISRSRLSSRDEGSSVEAEFEREEGLRRVNLNLPNWMVADLQSRAKREGTTITELIRRAVSLERTLLSDPDNIVVVRSRSTERESILTVL